MPAIVVTILVWFTRYLILNFLLMLGLAVVSYSIIQYLFDKYVNAGLAYLGSMGGDMSAFIGIAHLDHALSIVLGAYSVRASIIAAKPFIAKMIGG